MPIGERSMPRRGCRRPAPRRGFSYLLLLFSLAIGAAALATLGTQWQVAAQREREAELLFRGLQLRDALQRFHDQTPAGQPALPQTLDELLVDRRRTEPRHHLRQPWTDPFTGAADWVLLRQADGGIVGLHSRSARPLLRRTDLPAGVSTPGLALAASTAVAATTSPAHARDWHFAIQPRRPRPRTSP